MGMGTEVVRPRPGLVHWRYSADPDAWTVILTLPAGKIPQGIPLTRRALIHWQQSKDRVTGYCSFATLTSDDAIAILSASRRAEVSLSPDRWGRVAFYRVRAK